jgi:outer membrane protein TolC
VALDFTYPVCDGGASAAAVHAAHYQAERARLELERARQTARAEIRQLLDQCEVGRRRLEILSQQADLAAERLRIAAERFEDERINRLQLLQAKINLLEARGKHLTELMNYEVNRIELFGRFEE